MTTYSDYINKGHRPCKAMIHSTESVGDIVLIEKVGDNDYIVMTKEGIKCHAIFNPFRGLYYADDLYTVVKD